VRERERVCVCVCEYEPQGVWICVCMCGFACERVLTIFACMCAEDDEKMSKQYQGDMGGGKSG